ncbi:MAG TPA: hypothetical protein PKD72_09130 [Gemmatales bacterium]|nr:hypothetical protein [Gemmatales bacterium]
MQHLCNMKASPGFRLRGWGLALIWMVLSLHDERITASHGKPASFD